MLRILLIALVTAVPSLSKAAPSGPGFTFREVSPGVFRGGRPSKEAQISWLSEQGIRTMINLQGRVANSQPGEKPEEIAESEAIARRFGIEYLRRPFSTGGSHTLAPDEIENILSSVEVLKDPKYHPVYVHCFFGVDRTGVTIASFRILVQGCSFEKARDEMYAVGGFWTPHVTEGQLPFLQELAARPRPGESECPL